LPSVVHWIIISDLKVAIGVGHHFHWKKSRNNECKIAQDKNEQRHRAMALA